MFARFGRFDFLIVWLLLHTGILKAMATILTPPYLNLALDRKIYASATCGDEGQEELYCKLVGANSKNLLYQNFSILQGQFCDYCDPTRPDKMHPPEYAVDGMETWWQSPPLSRGMKYNEVNLTIDLGQEFHVAYVFIRMGISPRPGLWILEKSADYGLTYTPWQYFSDSAGDCLTYFGKDSNEPISRDDSVICSTEYSKIVPLEGGEIPISLLNNRPNATNYFNSSILQEWTRATNVRFRFLRTKNLLGHLMSVARQDPTVTRRYFYSIKDISIGGRCMCNGHADTCDNRDPNDPTILLCRCQHNTCGPKCDRCCPGYEQKAWRQSKSYSPFSCEPCNCFLHSRECVYDAETDRQRLSLDIHGKFEGGGVCQNCQHNTEGINCNRCKATFYRPYEKHWNETDVCQPCNCDIFYSTGNCEEGSGRCECRKEFTPPNCDSCSFGYYDYPHCKPCDCFLNGTYGLQCEATEGQCPCKVNFGGKFCKECSANYYNFPECKDCECNPSGSISTACDQQYGNCTCRSNYGGEKCDRCQHGYYNYPQCEYCNCDVKGTKEGVCDKETGQCWCKDGYSGDRCDQCMQGFYGYPDCRPCNCSSVGATTTVCDVNGKCPCLRNFAGRTCNQCSPGYYKFPECLACLCDTYGSNGISCNNEGNCECHHNFDGQRCEKCKEGFYNFPSCEDCNCHPAGVVEGFAGCGSVPAGELCQCKERVEGRICNKCKPLYWNLSVKNPEGCEDCGCNPAGVLGGVLICDSERGQCPCKPSVVARGCTECEDGTYNLQKENLFGCTDCGCDVGGSLSSYCDKTTGQCYCQARVTGRTCTEPLQAHYFPTLYQYQYEIEDGRTPHNSAVRYFYDENDFPDYSWRGYAVFSVQQNEVLQDVYITKPSVYLVVLRYVNKNANPVAGTVTITPDVPSDLQQQQRDHVSFKNSSAPTSVVTDSLVMNPGRWTFSIKVDGDLLIDYFVLLPEEFYLATILKQKIENPCKIFENGLCRDFQYPNISSYDSTQGSGGYIEVGPAILPPDQYYQDRDHLDALNIDRTIPLINNQQPAIHYEVIVHKAGPYVVLLNYVTPRDDPRTHNIDVDVINLVNQTGKAELYACPYTTICRQVLTTPRGDVAVYQADVNNMKFVLKGNNANVGIHSIVAIPWGDWSLDHIRPRSVCVRRDGQCQKSMFPNPPESKKLQFEQDVEGAPEAEALPPVVKDNVTSYIYLNGDNPMIDLKGKVANPGYYMFVVHYYQPDFPEFDMDILIQNGQFYEAKLPLSHCPSKSGCRSIIAQPDRVNQFSLNENFMITHKLPDKLKNAYLDYILVIPSDVYSPKILEEEEFDRANEFISTCGSNQFNVDTSRDGFCKDSVFSITAGYNNGALECQCDYHGSLSFECDKYGGQCKCKPNIVGRQCEACKTGYYGFPDCKPCSCPSTAICETNTGNCICPEYVTGARCDQCMPETYGFHPIIGCELCKCDPLGVNGSLQCDLITGACDCKENIVGRTCDVCKSGHFSYPYCEICECDTSGTLEDICDQISAECFCKKYVVGPQCNICKEGSYNLQASNEDGCTECFCFGKTTRCSSSNLIRTAVFYMKNWNLVHIGQGERLNVTSANLTLRNHDEYTIEARLSNASLADRAVYFAVPNLYLGKKLTSYGGSLKYNLYYSIGESGKALYEPDIILEGANTFLTHTSSEQPANEQVYVGSLDIVEDNFELPSKLPANREHIMTVLKELRGIYIRASYWSVTYSTKLSNVFLDEASSAAAYHDSNKYSRALSVEHCQCPPNYQGLSCEECSPGYYRVSTGSHGFSCIPCQCNGHAETCDVNTGVCLNCQHNTKGEHCEQCAIGYHGNAQHGTPMDCLICACPLPILSNNFATGCEVSYDGNEVDCECVDGYGGSRCQYCASGYYGKPEVPEDYCRPCQCNGNIDPSMPDACDRISGDCLNCLNNTYGSGCSLCRPGYYGDAIERKDCQPCLCDELGTKECDSFTGLCICKQNVIGEKCDRCALEHYGFETGNGCTPCNCGTASESNQCDDSTGQCMCKPGVDNRNCDRCKPDFWNYTVDGCLACKCNKEYSLGVGCNAATGQCECLNGVIGEKCDHCPHRWAFVPNYGCHSCDSCVDNLLDTADELAFLIDSVVFDLDSAESGSFTSRRLFHLNDTFQRLKPRILALDPNATNFSPVMRALNDLEVDSQNMYRKTNYSLENSNELLKESVNLRNESDRVSDEAYDAIDVLDETINWISQLEMNLSLGEGPKIDAALNEATELLEELKRLNVSEPKEAVDKRIDDVELLIFRLHVFKVKIDEQEGTINGLRGKLKDFDDKLDDLYNHTGYTLSKVAETNDLIVQNGKERVKQKFEKILNYTREAKNIVEKAEVDLNNGTLYYEMAKNAYNNLAEHINTLQLPINLINKTVTNVEEQIPDIEAERLPDAQLHADNLTQKAQNLDNIFKETQGISENALKAVNAYLNIEDAIKEAYGAAQQSKEFIENATSFYDNLNTEIVDTIDASNNASESATQASQRVELELKPQLNEAVVKSRKIRSLHEKNKNDLEHIEDFIRKYPGLPYEDLLVEAIQTTEKANLKTEDTMQALGNNYNKVPAQTAEAQQLPKKMDETDRHLRQVDNQLEIIKDKLPKIISDLSSFPQVDRLGRSEDLDDQIKKLKQQISLARDIANRIKVGVRFYPNTTLELRNPDNLEELSTSTKITGYFRTNNTYGLLLYLGNENGTTLRRRKADDFMALEIENGYPVLTLDIGNGQERVLNTKFVSDGNWYQFIIERTGLNAKLIIREEIADGKIKDTISESGLQPPYIIFNLDRNQSKLFVGGYPSEFTMQDAVHRNSFDGEMEEIVIGDTPVSLWNFNNGFENHRGARERNRLVNLSPSTGCRFSGTAFVVIDARRYAYKARNNIQLNFKTFASEGLLFLYGNATTYIAIEMRGGKVLFKYNLGYGTKSFQTVNTYNDGEWHLLKATRDGADGRLVVDAEEIRAHSGDIQGNAVGYSDYFYFGGYVKKHDYPDVTNKGFDGCIDNVDAGNPINLNSNYKAYGITPGCPVKFARLVSFTESEPGYIKLSKIYVQDDITMALKFRTNSYSGLIFYLTDGLQESGISLSLINGKLKLISQRQELVTKDGNFNDSQWHVVSITHNKEVLRLDFDDYEYVSSADSPPSLNILQGHLYIGGIPAGFVAKEGRIASSESFVGCIADATLNGSIINFANSTERVGDILGTCILDLKTAPNFDEVPELPPVPKLESYTTLGPQYATEAGHLDEIPQRGDLGGLQPGVVPTTLPSLTFPPLPEEEDTEPPPVEEPITKAPDILTERTTIVPATTTTTAKPPPISPRIVPKPVPATPEQLPEPPPSCALPMILKPVDEVAGPFYFGTNPNSRIQYNRARGKFRKHFRFSFDIKTNDTAGVIFYAANNDNSNFVILYMEKGQLIYKILSSKIIHDLQTVKKYNDGQWHNVMIVNNQSMQLTVDDNLEGERKSKAIGKLEIAEPLYLGGLREEHTAILSEYGNIVHSFKGCIRDFYMNNKSLEDPVKNHVLPCPENMEEGNYFNSGYAVLKARYTVGDEIDIKMDIKPRNITGLLLTVHGKRDYLVLEMYEGGIKFTVDNGRGPITTKFSPDRVHYLCDGHWHTIQAIKSKNVVSLSVDNKYMTPGIGDHRSKSTDTGGALFLGSHRVITKVRGITARVPFIGCIKNIHINTEPIIVTSQMRRGDIVVGQCPTN